MEWAMRRWPVMLVAQLMWAVQARRRPHPPMGWPARRCSQVPGPAMLWWPLPPAPDQRLMRPPVTLLAHQTAATESGMRLTLDRGLARRPGPELAQELELERAPTPAQALVPVPGRTQVLALALELGQPRRRGPTCQPALIMGLLLGLGRELGVWLVLRHHQRSLWRRVKPVGNVPHSRHPAAAAALQAPPALALGPRAPGSLIAAPPRRCPMARGL